MQEVKAAGACTARRIPSANSLAKQAVETARTGHACSVIAVGVLDCQGACPRLGVPHLHAFIPLAASSNDVLPVWCELSAPDRAAVSCVYLRGP